MFLRRTADAPKPRGCPLLHSVVLAWGAAFAGCCFMGWQERDLYGQEPWLAAKLREGPVPFGGLQRDGSISVEGYFERRDTIYRVLSDRDRLVELSDGIRAGWVPKSRLLQVEPERVRAPDFPSQARAVKPTTKPRHDLLGQFVFYREQGTAMIGDQVVDKSHLDFPAMVEEVDGDWLWLGRGWMKRSDVDNTAEFFATALLEVYFQPQSAAAWRRRALAWGAKGEWSYGVKDFTKAIECDPGAAENWIGRGYARIQTQDLRSAIEDFNEALRIDPGQALAYRFRGMAMETASRFDDAIKDFEKAIERDLQDVRAWFGKANANEAKGLLEEALKDFDRCIAIDPRMAMAWNNRGLCWSKIGEADRAMADFNEAINLLPRFSEAFSNRGVLRMEQQDYHGAIEDFDRALAIDPKDSFTLNNRGNAKQGLKDYAGAIADRDEAIRLDPSNAVAIVNRGVSKFLSRDYTGALADYDEGIRVGRQSLHAYSNKAFLLATSPMASMRDPVAAKENAAQALTIDATNGYALNAMACAVALAGDFDSAIEWETKAIQVPGYVLDRDIDGGFHAADRIERWKKRSLWLLPEHQGSLSGAEATSLDQGSSP